MAGAPKIALFSWNFENSKSSIFKGQNWRKSDDRWLGSRSVWCWLCCGYSAPKSFHKNLEISKFLEKNAIYGAPAIERKIWEKRSYFGTSRMVFIPEKHCVLASTELLNENSKKRENSEILHFELFFVLPCIVPIAVSGQSIVGKRPKFQIPSSTSDRTAVYPYF